MRLLWTCSIHTRAIPRNSGSTLKITFATYCDNLSYYDESWMVFFLFTQKIPAGPKYFAARCEIEISSALRKLRRWTLRLRKSVHREEIREIFVMRNFMGKTKRTFYRVAWMMKETYCAKLNYDLNK